MKDKKERIITLEEFKKLQNKMKQYNLTEGYVDNDMNLFVWKCERATALITLKQVEDAISELEKIEEVC